MRHSTEYLFGKPRNAYEPHLSLLAKRKIIDAKFVLQEISKSKDTVPKEEIPALIERYQAVEKAKEHWEAILEEV